MNSELKELLSDEIDVHSIAYVRNLVGAEAAVLAGQFNLAKILRAAAHSQRTLALNAARALSDYQYGQAILNSISQEVQVSLTGQTVAEESSGLQLRLEQAEIVKGRLREIVMKSLKSLENNSDVLETDVHMFLRACHSCGNVVEGGLPDVCEICGALAVEFQSFGPFYSSTPEHLGQLTPEVMIEIMGEIPVQVSELFAAADPALLEQKPTEAEWSAKEILSHLIETDRNFANRVRSIFQKTDYVEPDLPPWKRHEEKGYEQLSAQELVAAMRETRSETLDLVRGLSHQEWTVRDTRFGGTPSVLDLGTWLTNHDRGHVAQIKGLLERRSNG
jgi:rubrerythrin/uncharacterized damage-inducible protein DinB